MNFKIYLIGKITDKSHKKAIAEYHKRLSRYCKIKVIEVKDKDALLKRLSDNTYIILVSPNGSQLSSEDIARKINELGVTGKSDVSLIYGISDLDYQEHLSISNMNMSIGMTIIILYEQIYRGYRILRNEPYCT